MTSTWRVIRLTLLAVMTMTVALTVWAVATWRVKEVRVSMSGLVSSAEILEAADLAGDERILWMRTGRIARRIEAIPAVARASVRRQLPDTITIDVIERLPVVRIADRQGMVADGAGVVFPSATGRLPVLHGWSGLIEPGRPLDETSVIVLRSFAELDGSLRRDVVSIAVGPSVTFVLASGTEVRFGRPVDLVSKAAAAQQVLDQRAGADLAYIDVRTPTVVTSRDRIPPTPSPGPSPGPSTDASPTASTPEAPPQSTLTPSPA